MFRIEVREALSRTVEVEANSADEALAFVESAYATEDIILDSSDYLDTTFTLLEGEEE